MFEGDRHTKWKGCQYTESGDTLIVGKKGGTWVQPGGPLLARLYFPIRLRHAVPDQR